MPTNEKLVLNFVLSYLESEQLPAQLLVNGGYVRDMLLGKTPDDLDLSICLRDCPPEITIDSILTGLTRHARRRPELTVTQVNVTTILSDTSKDKNVDTAKAHLTVGEAQERIEVDLMPTIGEETYDERDRVPVRDVRGTPAQDALRRDLTIGAMMLEISRGGGSGGSGGGDGGAVAAAEGLQWRLLDFYGGLADLQKGILRSPYPSERALSEVYDEVFRTSADEEIATRLGLYRAVAPAEGVDVAAEEDRALQIIWWVKVLRDDPLRVLRALRFSAKLSFELHGAFWAAVPFALGALQGKVAGSRKNTELLKIAKSGQAPLLDFMRLAFGQSVPNVTAVGGAALEAVSAAELPISVLAPSLFGGADPKGIARFLAEPNGFDEASMRDLLASLPPSGLTEDEALGTALAAAAHSCSQPWGADDADDADDDASMADASETASVAGDVGGGGAAEPARERTADEELDEAEAAAATEAYGQVSAACDGLCASNELRMAAEAPLFCAAALLRRRPPTGMSRLFAEAAGMGGDGAGDEFAAMVQMWDVLKLEKGLQGKAPSGYYPHFAVALAGLRCSEPTRVSLRAQLDKLLKPGVAINGKALVGMGPRLPNHLRGVLISQLHVMTRLRGDAIDIAKPDQLTGYLEQASAGLIERLYAEWYDDDGELRPDYAQPTNKAKKKK